VTGLGIDRDLTAVLDYPEEGVELRDPRPALAEVRSRINELLATAEAGRLAERGARLALVGRPNVGKSSLLNALLGFERSIVSASPGTTRDYLEAPLELEGVPLTAVDTAGVRDASDEIEASGVQRALALAENADLVLCLLDLSRPLTSADRALLERLGQARTLVIASKADLPAAWSPGEAHPHTIPISATRGDGLDELRGRIRVALLGDAAGTELWLSNDRHAEALRRTEALLARAEDAPDDLMALDLQEALEVLAGLTGRGEIAEDTLAHVFANFCVGK
jgi:tRNA modification GTPase